MTKSPFDVVHRVKEVLYELARLGLFTDHPFALTEEFSAPLLPLPLSVVLVLFLC